MLSFELHPRGAAAEGRGPQGGRPAALQEPQEQKETATAPPWSKQPALAAAQGRAAASEPSALTPSLPPPVPRAWPQEIRLARRSSLLGVGSRPPQEEAGQTRAIRSPGPSLAPARASSCPAPFPPGFPVDLPTHCYVRLGGVGARAQIRPDRSRRRFHTRPPLQLGFCRRALRTLLAGERGASSSRVPAQVRLGLRHTPPRGLDSFRPPPSPRPTSSPVSTPSV